ncbi:hypothetical protein Cv017_12125 [Chromobacterium subtsugae]|nr:hypothetical protein Cv017_12125 [Chromobacterium subtsugae]
MRIQAMNNAIACAIAAAASLLALATTSQAAEWRLGDIKTQECLKNSTLISSSIKYCHNCVGKQGNLTSWTFTTTCDGKLQTRLAQSKINCNTPAGQASETAQKTTHTQQAAATLPGPATPCK